MFLQSCITLLTRSLVRSRDEFKKLYLQYQNAYGDKAWHSGYIQRRASFHKVMKSFDHVFMQRHETKQMRYISNTTVTTTTKLGSGGYIQ